jgi:hypothetical protein
MNVPAINQRGLHTDDWRAIRCFTEHEVAAACQDGLWQNIDAGSFYLLDQFASYLVAGRRLITSVQLMPTRTRDGIPTATWNLPDTNAHAGDSMHYRGRAFDVMFPRTALATAWFTALRFPKFGGIGAYPFWRPDPGLHLDTRFASGDEQGRGFRVMWWADADRRYHYLNDEHDILRFLETLQHAS